MFTLPLFSWIGNAAAVLCGRHGEVTAAAEQAGCSRQTVYDHAAKVHQAVQDARLPGPSRQTLIEQVAGLQEENRQLWDWLDQALDCPLAKQQQFTVTACAMGLSLSQTLILLAILLPANRLPSRATLGRWVQHSARRAGRLLQRLDRLCRPLILCLCLDEIFFRRQPVLMAVEPHSLAWVIGQRAADRSGDTWANALAAWPDLEDVAADGGNGIERGLELIEARRQEAAEQPGAAPAKPLRVRLDVFHIRRDGARALRQQWAQAEQTWEQAEQVERAKKRFDRQGTDRRRFNKTRAQKAWQRAEAAFEQVCHREQAWRRAAAALQIWRPDGRLNERSWAEAELAAAAEELTGSVWAKVVRQLRDERTLTFLDRLHEELAQAEPDPERRQALLALWRWQRQKRGQQPAAAGGVVGQVSELVEGLIRERLGEGWQQAYRRVSRVLKRVVRASSAVECVNSIVRMHQSRHKNLSQELLDLKRLFFNCRAFREGKRRSHCPYQLLGLVLPTYDPWALLQMDPAQLEQLLSSPRLAA
ncbi:MAG: hypothetical protein JO244_02845 [Solirubrobacterales bacterium]|nr:hypothetical protein [Solirubrobacterales bacterium]